MENPSSTFIKFLNKKINPVHLYGAGPLLNLGNFPASTFIWNWTIIKFRKFSYQYDYSEQYYNSELKSRRENVLRKK